MQLSKTLGFWVIQWKCHSHPNRSFSNRFLSQATWKMDAFQAQNWLFSFLYFRWSFYFFFQSVPFFCVHSPILHWERTEKNAVQSKSAVRCCAHESIFTIYSLKWFNVCDSMCWEMKLAEREQPSRHDTYAIANCRKKIIETKEKFLT